MSKECPFFVHIPNNAINVDVLFVKVEIVK